MQSVSSRIWTRVAVYTSYDDNHYTICFMTFHESESDPGPTPLESLEESKIPRTKVWHIYVKTPTGKKVLTNILGVYRSYIWFLFVLYYSYLFPLYPVGWGSRIHRLHFCRGVRPLPNECTGYDTKQFDGEVPVLLELWGMQSTPSLPSLPDPLWPGLVAPDRVLSMGQIELNCSFESLLFSHLNGVLMQN